MRSRCGPIALALVVAAGLVRAQTGWRMRDRFTGFRFECGGAESADARRERVQGFVDLADDLSGFGWVQESPRGSLVGEFRGTPETAATFRDGLGAPVWEVDVHGDVVGVAGGTMVGEKTVEWRRREGQPWCIARDYPDTKIALHFSHFKVLDARRVTCFQDEPHRCDPNDPDIQTWMLDE
jgi:hypothetical protein